MHTSTSSNSRTPHRQTRIKLLDAFRLRADRRSFRGFDHGCLQGRKGRWGETTRTLAAGLAGFDGRAIACTCTFIIASTALQLPRMRAQWLQIHLAIALLLLDVALLVHRKEGTRKSLPLDVLYFSFLVTESCISTLLCTQESILTFAAPKRSSRLRFFSSSAALTAGSTAFFAEAGAVVSLAGAAAFAGDAGAAIPSAAAFFPLTFRSRFSGKA